MLRNAQLFSFYISYECNLICVCHNLKDLLESLLHQSKGDTPDLLNFLIFFLVCVDKVDKANVLFIYFRCFSIFLKK